MNSDKEIKTISLDQDEDLLELYNSNTSWTLTKNQAKLSDLIAEALKGDPGCSKIELKKEDWILEKVTEFVKYHYDNPMATIEKPIKSENFNELVSDWDFKFLNNIKNSDLIELTTNADYFIIKDLLSLCLCKLACLVKSNASFD